MDEYICMICNKKTTYNDRVCIKCHKLKPDHIPLEQYIKYFKQLTKKIYK
jgi:hypothetical protein